MGCGGSKVNEINEETNNNSLKTTHITSGNLMKKRTTINEIEENQPNLKGASLNNNSKKEKTGRTPVKNAKTDTIIISYYVIEIVSKTEIQFKEKFSIPEQRNSSKKTIEKYLTNLDQKNDFLKNMKKEKMEFFIYCFNYNIGKQTICNYYETEDIDLSLICCSKPKEQQQIHSKKSSSSESLEKYKDCQIQGKNNGDEGLNKDKNKLSRVNNNDNNANEGKHNNSIKAIQNNANNSSNNSYHFDYIEFIYSVWIIDIELIDIDPVDIIEILRFRDEVKDLKLFCENLGDVFVEIEPDLNDKGIIEYNPPENTKELAINRELDETILQSSKESLEKDYIDGVYIRRNKFVNTNFLFGFLKLIRTMHPDRIVNFTFSDNLNIADNWNNVIEAIATFNNLHNLNLSMGFIYDKFLVNLCNSIKAKRIVILDLSSNFITYVGSRTIGKWIKGNRTLKQLYIQQNTMNEFKREGFDFIADPLKLHPNINQVDFSFMILTGFGTKLAELVRESLTLKVLKIRNVRMNYNDYTVVMPALGENKILEEVYLNDNNPMKEGSIDLIAKMIATNKTIHTLYLDKIGLSLENSKPFFVALKLNTTIQTLSLNDNPEMSVKKFTEFIRESTTLKKINFMNRNSNAKRSKEDIIILEKLQKEKTDVQLKY